MCLLAAANKTRSTGTVQTSAKARLTSAAIRRMSVNECPLSLTTFRISQNPENNPYIQAVIQIATKI